jgi:hypothetical protein
LIGTRSGKEEAPVKSDQVHLPRIRRTRRKEGVPTTGLRQPQEGHHILARRDLRRNVGALKTAELPTVGSNGSREEEEKEGIDQPKEDKATEQAQPSKQPEVQQDPLGKAEAGKPKTSRLKPSWYYEEVEEDQPLFNRVGATGEGCETGRSRKQRTRRNTSRPTMLGLAQGSMAEEVGRGGERWR